MNLSRLAFVALVTSALGATPALAHGDEDHEAEKAHKAPSGSAGSTAKPGHEAGAPGQHHGAKEGEKKAHPSPHGGAVASTTGHRHLEIVRRPDGLDLYLFDSEMAPAPGAVTDAKATVVVGKERTVFTFTGSGSHLTANGTVPAGQAQLVLQGKVDGKPETVKFRLE